MKKLLRLCRVLGLSALVLPSLMATTATSLSSFGGVEESAQKYFPSSNTFQSDSFANATDLGGGVFQMTLRYNTSGTMWWDGDRTTGNTDRQREEAKTLGAHQLIHQTYDYTTTWKMNTGFKGSGAFCHITQLKPVDGVEGSSGAPMVVTSLFSGSSSAAVRYASASFSPANVFTAHVVRTITYSPGVFLAEKIRVKTTADGENTGEVLVSLNGDFFQGVTNTEVCRPSSTEYYPKWGFYRGVSTSSGFGPSDFVQHSNVSAGPTSTTQTVADPTFSPGSGTYTSAQSVTISTSTSGASIRYTTDGSTPTTTTGTLYSGPVSVTASETLTAIAYESGFNNSNVTSASYTIQCAAPTFSPAGGTYVGAQTVSLSTSTGGASIRYTTDGSTPTSTTGTLYAGAFTVASNTTVKAIAFASGLSDSTVSTATYTIQCATPTFSPGGGTYSSAQSVTIASATAGSSIRYTTDGSTPTSTTGTLYSGPVTIGSTATLKAIAFAPGLADSAVASATYTISVPQVAAPTFSPAGGTYSSAQTVAISTTTSGASIRYTTDGSTPTSTTGTLYSGAIAISGTTTLKAIAFESGFTDSAVTSATYTITTGTTVSPTDGFVNIAFGSTQTGSFTATIDAVPSLSPSNTTIGLCQGAQTAYTGLACIVRFNTSGNIDARNGGAYAAASTIPFSAGVSYHFRFVVNVPAHTYSIYVTPAGGSEITVGSNYGFRTEVNTVTSLDTWNVDVAATPGGTVTVDHLTISGASQVAAPTFSPAGGTYSSAQSVTISTTTSGASIRYTTDGSTPTSTTGTLYTGPVTISATTTLKAIAYATGMTNSAVTSATYTINITPPPTVTFEAESLANTTSGPTVTTQADTNASGGVVAYFNATASGQWVDFTTTSIAGGTYQISFRYKKNTSRGQHTLSIDGVQVGGTIDEYSTTSGYTSVTVGTATLSAGTHTIRLAVTGKNASSTAYTLAPDSFTFVGQ